MESNLTHFWIGGSYTNVLLKRDCDEVANVGPFWHATNNEVKVEKKLIPPNFVAFYEL